MNSKTTNIHILAYSSLTVALIAICSWISIPTIVPFTMQTFAIALTLLLLGGKNGTTVILAYLLLGAAGIPVFSNMTGGIGHLFGTTGGYLTGFLFMGLVYWIITKIFTDKFVIKIIALILGLIICYAFGTIWFVNVYTANNGAIGYVAALGMCVFPYLIPDAIKLALAFALSYRLKKHIKS